MGNWHVYILRCRDGSLYTGYTNDLNSRIDKHNAGRGAKYTASRRPVTLVYQEPAETKEAAMKREIQIKRWTKAMKEALVARDRQQPQPLSKPHPF